MKRQEHRPVLRQLERVGDPGDLGGFEQRRPERRLLRLLRTRARVRPDELRGPRAPKDRVQTEQSRRTQDAPCVLLMSARPVLAPVPTSGGSGQSVQNTVHP